MKKMMKIMSNQDYTIQELEMISGYLTNVLLDIEYGGIADENPTKQKVLLSLVNEIEDYLGAITNE